MARGNRAWLNTDKSSTACIAWSVDGSYANLEVRDCSRSVNLEFHFSNGRRKKCLAKLDRMLAIMNELRKEISGDTI